MIAPDELIVDNFAGGGGASTGIEMALGRDVDIAINHSPEAIALHKANHPRTRHYCENVWDVSPREACGGRPVAAVTRDELETLRDDLDELVRDGRMAWKTALNTWGIVRKLFAEAAGAKKRELRVRATDPAAGIQPPDRGRARARTHLYPSELAAVLASPRVELRLRRLFALAVYSYCRIGELAALTAADVDLVHGVLDVHKAVDGKTRKVHAPKTPAGTRLVPIEPALRPLLEHLVAEAGGGLA